MDEIVLINTFDVAPEQTDALLAALAAATDGVVKSFPGFVSATFHVSLDRTKVTNYAKWRSLADLQAMLEDSRAKPHLDECIALAKGYWPIIYRVASVHEA